MTTSEYMMPSWTTSHHGRNAFVASEWPRICLLRSPASAAILLGYCWLTSQKQNKQVIMITHNMVSQLKFTMCFEFHELNHNPTPYH